MTVKTYTKSVALLERALKKIPTASQTFSKSHLVYPIGSAPLFVTHGQGSHIWDVDGNEYIDYVSALLPVLLGYRDPDVDQAIKEQLENGISFSLPTPLEIELSEELCSIIPCADMVRFGKNGTDATSAAIRLARAATGRDHIVVCGYHGWQDWYVGTTVRSRGVPKAVQDLTHKIIYDDLEAFHDICKRYPGQIAGIIMEPMSMIEPPAGYLQEMREIAHKNGALFMFDEVITGFRFALGGAQEHFGITPDLAAFGKALGNGMPISALAGKEKYMRLFEEVFFSGTFGGEALSLAASLAVIKKLKKEPVLEHIKTMGEQLAQAVSTLLKKYEMDEFISLKGHPSWKIFDVADFKDTTKEELKTYIMTRLFQQGLLVVGSHNMCYAHSQADIQKTIQAYEIVFSDLAEKIRTGRVRQDLGCEPVYPIFSIRSFTKH